MRKLIFFFLLVISISLQGQPENKFTGGYSPATPEAAAQGKYADIPVNLASGTASTSLPLGSIEDGPLSLDIGLNYHLGGIRVDETASWVGLGWSLNAGGMISRTVLGCPDDHSDFGYYYAGAQLKHPFIQQIEDGTQEQVRRAHTGMLDSEPDIFTFNFNGQSGKFVFNNNKEIIQITRSDLKIEVSKFVGPEQNQFGEFVITTPDGVRYIFGSSEYYESSITPKFVEKDVSPTLPTANQYFSSWYLAKVVSADGHHEINLDYEYEGNVKFFTKTVQSTRRFIYSIGNCINDLVSPGNNTPVENRLKKWRLKCIESTYQKVDFIASSDRLDFAGTKRLDEIHFKTGVDTKNFKKIKLAYTYTDTEDEINIPANYKEFGRYRLRLEGIHEKPWDNSSVKNPYSFEYYDGELPNRFSLQVDHWGYFNGTGNANNISNYGGVPPNPFYYPAITFPWATGKRESNESKMKIGSLKKIIYPHGGDREFVLESNKVVKSECPDGEPFGWNNIHSQTTCSFPLSSDCCYDEVDGLCSQQYYTHEESILDQIKIRISGVQAISNECSPNNSDGHVQVRVLDLNGTEIGFLGLPIPGGAGNSEEAEYSLSSLFDPVEGETYIIEVCSWENVFGQFYIYDLVQYECPEILSDIGGLRVKEIRENPVLGAEEKVIKYNYVDPAGEPSGRLYSKPQYAGDVIRYNIGQEERLFTKILNTSYFPLSSYQGNIVTYEYVEEVIEGKGKTRNIFYLEEDPWANPNYPDYTLPLAPLRAKLIEGNLKKKIMFNEEGEEVYEEIYEYESPDYENIVGISYKTDGANDYGFTCILTSVKMYENRIGHKRLSKKTTIKDGVETVENYHYDPEKRFQMVIAKDYTNSKDQLCRTEYTYNHDYPNSVIKSQLVTQYNIISEPWKTLKYVDGNPVSGQKNTYGEFSGLPRKTKIYQYLSGWKERATIKNYDSEGNVSVYAQTGWGDEVFKWDPGSRLTLKKYEKFKTRYKYYPGTKLISEIVSIDDLSTFYKYDNLQRLESTSKRDGLIKNSYKYHYYDGSDPYNWTETTLDFASDNGDAKTIKSKNIINGFGSSIQVIKCGYSPNGKDVITNLELDVFDSPLKEYQPVEGGNSCSYSSNGTDFWKTEYESSPLSRPIFKKLSSWTAGVGTFYDCNSEEDEVVLYEAGCGTVSSGLYPDCSLYKTTNVDENANPTEVFTDKDGKQVLVRKFIGRNYSPPLSNAIDSKTPTIDAATGIKKVDTYYIYDDRGNLVLVISPESADGSSGDLNFCYEYDDLNRLIKKDLPGAGPITMDYYDSDLLKWESDANGNTLNYIYDIYGRLSQKYFGGSFNVDDFNGGSLIQEHVYFDSNADNQFLSKLESSSTATITGDNIIGDLLTTQFIEYDQYSRLMKAMMNNNVGGVDRYTYSYADHADNMQNEERKHSGYSNLVINNIFTYDHSSRLLSHNYLNSLLGGTQSLSSNSYTYKDELKSKTVGGIAPMDYQYNSRSWLTSINSLGSSHPFEDNVCVPEVPFEIDLEITPFIPCDAEIAAQSEYLSTIIADTTCSVVHYQLVSCDSIPDCPTDGYEMENLPYVISTFKESITEMDAFEMGYPQNLIRIRLCNGSEMYITDSQLLYAQINGVEIPNYIILQEICIHNIMQPISYTGQDGDISIVPFYVLMEILNAGQVPQVEEYPECGEELSCSSEISHSPTKVTRIGLNTYLGVNYGQTFGDCDVTDEYFNNNNDVNSICTRGSADGLSSECANRLDIVCFEFDPYKVDCEDFLIDSTRLIINHEFNKCENSPWIWQENITLNGNAYKFGDDIVVNNEEILKVCITLPNDLYNVAPECETCIFDVKRVTYYTCDCSTEDPPITEDGDPSCTCTPIDPVDDPPCVDVLPDCTDEEKEAQDEYIEDLMIWAENVTLSEVDFPIEMCRTTLCDGRQISIPTQYLEENTFPGPLDCDFITSGQEPPADDCIIQNPLFAMKFSYNTPNSSYTGATPQYNGNISQIEQQLVMKHIEGINYQYDQLDRLTEQDYWWRSCKEQYWNNKFYNVENITYDLNGNMKTIKRHTKPFQVCEPETGVIDNLNMTYAGNQLVSVSDGSNLEPEMGYILGDYDGGYGYDANGNMTTIGNKPFTLGYNFLNLPSTIGLDGAGGLGTPAWTYTANGEKLKYKENEYFDGIEYKNGKLYAIHHAEGRLFPKEQTEDERANNASLEWEHQFYIRDHLGNTRIVIDESGQPIQENNYYPFGMNMDNIDIVEDNEDRDTRFIYNGKEMNEDLGWLDYGARFYDPFICRWNSVDPLAEDYYSYSSYNYVMNNPLRFIDPDGRKVDDIIVLFSGRGTSNLGSRHSAVLIGDDKNGWTYVSKDGGENVFSGPSIGTNGIPFETLEDFQNSKLADDYDKGYRVETDAQGGDADALDAAKESQAEDYDTSGECNCTAPAKAALETAGIETTDSWRPSQLESDLKQNPSVDGAVIYNVPDETSGASGSSENSNRGKSNEEN